MDTNFQPVISATARGHYRQHPLEFKRALVALSLEPGASVARIARAHGVNANQVFSWRRQYQRGELVAAVQDAREVPLLPVQIHQPHVPAVAGSSGKHEAPTTEDCLEIEFSGGRHIRVWGRADAEALRTAIRELSQS